MSPVRPFLHPPDAAALRPLRSCVISCSSTPHLRLNCSRLQVYKPLALRRGQSTKHARPSKLAVSSGQTASISGLPGGSKPEKKSFMSTLVHGWRLDNLRQDIFGGITAAVVAVPLALAFGVASGSLAIFCSRA